MEIFFALLAICAGNSPVPGEFPPHKGQWRGALMFSLICVWINGLVNNGEAGDLRRYRTHYDLTVMASWRHHDTETLCALLHLCRKSTAHWWTLIRNGQWYVSLMFYVSRDKLMISSWVTGDMRDPMWIPGMFLWNHYDHIITTGKSGVKCKIVFCDLAIRLVIQLFRLHMHDISKFLNTAARHFIA